LQGINIGRYWLRITFPLQVAAVSKGQMLSLPRLARGRPEAAALRAGYSSLLGALSVAPSAAPALAWVEVSTVSGRNFGAASSANLRGTTDDTAAIASVFDCTGVV
jgi:hypothetical protein